MAMTLFDLTGNAKSQIMLFTDSSHAGCTVYAHFIFFNSTFLRSSMQFDARHCSILIAKFPLELHVTKSVMANCYNCNCVPLTLDGAVLLSVAGSDILLVAISRLV